jgi:DNA-binding transcriptional MerR regulator
MNLISKKDLLAITGISYGQLYRWKREHLIPEEWFIKQSAYTGQETFFPRDQILSRIKSILDLKDLYSLEELAKILSPEAAVAQINIDDLMKISEISKELLKEMPDIFGGDQFEFHQVALAIAISQTAEKLGLTLEQTAKLLRISVSVAFTQKTTNICCTVIETEDGYHTVFSPNAILLAFDSSVEVKDQQSLSEITDMIKTKYKNLFIK